MELKLYLFSSFLLHQICLNRTFYGIETIYRSDSIHTVFCLNRTFYGIETSQNVSRDASFACLNRTFYGIETYQELYCYQR